MPQATTLAKVKAQLEITDTDDDAYIGELIDDVTDWMEAFCLRWLVARNSATYLLDTAAGFELDVRRYGVRAVSSLGIASSNQPDTGGSYTAIAAADIVLRPPAIERNDGMPATSIAILGSSARLSDAINGASVTMTAGPSPTPLRVDRVARDAVCAAYQARKAGGSGVIGAGATAVVEWSKYFAEGSPQLETLLALRGGPGIA